MIYMNIPKGKHSSAVTQDSYLGTPVVPFYPFDFGVSLLQLNIKKQGTLIIMGLLGNLAIEIHPTPRIEHVEEFRIGGCSRALIDLILECKMRQASHVQIW